MSKSFAIITPSYFADIKCCSLLAESVQKYAPESTKHYLIIPAKDYELFKPLESKKTKIVFEETLMPGWLKPLPFTRKWWFSFKTLPVRNWIRQQIIKLSTNSFTDASYYIFMDSDTFFTKAFEPEKLIDSNGKAPLFSEAIEHNDHYQSWFDSSAKILGLKEPLSSTQNYVGNFLFWTREDLLALQIHIESIHGCSWQEMVCRQIHFSEYTLYGIFIEKIRKQQSKHYIDPTIRTVNYWKETPASQSDLDKLRDELNDTHVGAMVSAKSNTPLERIRDVFKIAS